MISKKINIIINLLLEYFIRLNFNRKKEKFKKIHKYDFVYFFNDTIAKEISIHGIYEKDALAHYDTICCIICYVVYTYTSYT